VMPVDAALAGGRSGGVRVWSARGSSWIPASQATDTERGRRSGHERQRQASRELLAGRLPDAPVRERNGVPLAGLGHPPLLPLVQPRVVRVQAEILAVARRIEEQTASPGRIGVQVHSQTGAIGN